MAAREFPPSFGQSGVTHGPPPVAIAVLCCLLFSQPLKADETWLAGVAKTVITPPELMWMSGYGARDKPADGKIQDLWAKAIVLQDPAGHKVLLVTLDLVGIDRATSQQICERLQKAHGLDRSQIAIATSHTHTGPVVGTNLMAMYALDENNLRLVREYTALLVDSVVSVAAEAFASLAPAVIQTGEATHHLP